MLIEYMDSAMRHATYEILEDKSYYGEIPECVGVYANDETLEGCRTLLREVLEGWIFLHIKDGVELPVVDGIGIELFEPA